MNYFFPAVVTVARIRISEILKADFEVVSNTKKLNSFTVQQGKEFSLKFVLRRFAKLTTDA